MQACEVHRSFRSKVIGLENKVAELRSAGRPRAAVPTWSLLEAEVHRLRRARGPWILGAGSRGRPSPRGHCLRPGFIAFAGREAHGYSGQVHDGGRPHVVIARGRGSSPSPGERPMDTRRRFTTAAVPTWSLLEAEVHRLRRARGPWILGAGSRGRPSP